MIPHRDLVLNIKDGFRQIKVAAPSIRSQLPPLIFLLTEPSVFADRDDSALLYR